MKQQIRLSQFVITYGPGAILEGAYGPRIIPRPDIGLFATGSGLRPQDFVISEQRMSEGLLRGARIFRLPSNAELGLPQDRYIYRTKSFPTWKLCLNRRDHGGNFYVLYLGNSCAVCGNRGRGTEAIRFIKACPAGHMDEFDWNYFVHRGAGCAQTRWFRWYGGGGALSNIELECPQCGNRSTSLGNAYGQRWLCGGRFPEREPLNSPPYRPGCTRDARIIQRQASNLRIPELRTLFSIPPRYTTLHNLLQIPEIYMNIVGNTPSSKAQLQNILQNLAQRNLIGQSVADEILRYSWEEIQRAIVDVMSPIPTTYNGLILEEFHALIESSVSGAPPLHGPMPQSPVVFEVDPNRVRRYPGQNGTLFRVTPILRLRTITVQKGYRREVGTGASAEIVDISFPDPINPQQIWYPGAEFLGEGIFVMLDGNDGWISGLNGQTTAKWMNVFQNSSGYTSHVFRDITLRSELHPLFVWWHTVSHLLIRAISVEAGYSSASIRERVYFETDNSKVRGGILLYATQPGSEGTLGGLIALVPYFKNMLDIVFQEVQTCSGDPLCREHRFELGQYNGAACYGCLLLSETSCDHRNMWLDRNVLLENLP